MKFFISEESDVSCSRLWICFCLSDVRFLLDESGGIQAHGFINSGFDRAIEKFWDTTNKGVGLAYDISSFFRTNADISTSGNGKTFGPNTWRATTKVYA